MIALPPGLLLAADLATLWIRPPTDTFSWLRLWLTVVGAGFAFAGAAVTRWAPAPTPAVTSHRSGGPQPAGGLLLVGGTALQVAVVLFGLDADGPARALTGLAATLLLPLGLTRLWPRRGAAPVFRALDAVLVTGAVVAVAALGPGASTVALVGSWISGLALVGQVWLQFETTDGDDRRQVLWLVYGLSTSTPLGALFAVALDTLPLDAPAAAAGLALLSLPVPFCAAVAAIAPVRWDVRSVISRSVVGIVMMLLVVTVFSLGAALVELATGVADRGVMGLVVLGIAAAFHPVLRQVRALTDEVLFGGRADAVQALTGLGTSFAAGSTPLEWVGPLRSALAVPAVELRSDGQTVAAAGTIGDSPTVVTPLTAGTEPVGELVVALPSQYVRLPASTLAVLTLVAAPLAQALHATRLSEQLRASRGRVVAALEEERRRVRRDLHDGLGPTLTGIAYSADAAANLVRSDPAEAEALLARLRADATEAIAEIRRIVRGLRPKALDELGLTGAVRQQVDRLRAADGRAMQVSVEARAELPALPAAVEVVAYRVAVEAVTNVARHAGVAAAEVRLGVVGERLVVTVTDAGHSASGWSPGVGLSTMRERVEAVGGDLHLRSGPAGGLVRAELPLVSD